MRHTREIRDRHRLLLMGYDQGPFPAVRVTPPPEALVFLFEARTGKVFDADLFAAYERIRAYLGYIGVELTDELAVRRVAPGVEPERAGPRGIPSAAVPAAPGALEVDPHDLGD